MVFTVPFLHVLEVRHLRVGIKVLTAVQHIVHEPRIALSQYCSIFYFENTPLSFENTCFLPLRAITVG